MKMNRRLLIEILAAHADQLNLDHHAKSTYLTGFPEHRETLEPLLSTAEQAKQILAPAKPSPAFREDLRRSLLTAARQNRLVYPQARHSRLPVRLITGAILNRVGKGKTRVLVAATAGSAISLLSLVALFLRSRASHKSQAIGLA